MHPLVRSRTIPAIEQAIANPSYSFDGISGVTTVKSVLETG
ncbi:hypothetical protein [Pantanalinema sp. GBBB05]